MARYMGAQSRAVHGELSGVRRQVGAYNCQACEPDGKVVSARGWCSNCDELLCYNCYKIHCKPIVNRHHQLCSIAEMEKKKQRKIHGNKCETHKGKLLKYFCEDDSELSCSKCLKLNHRMCDTIVRIDDVVTTETEEFKALERELSKLGTRLKTSEVKVKQNTAIATRMHEKVVNDIQGAGVRLKSLIDRLVEKHISMANKVHEDNMRTIRDIEKDNKAVAEKLDDGRHMLSGKKNDNSQLFITMKHLEGETKQLGSRLDETVKKNRVKEYEFVLNSELPDALEKVEQLGSINDKQQLDRETATNDVVEVADVVEVTRFRRRMMVDFRAVYGEHAVCVSTDRRICLLNVLLYGIGYHALDVRLTISEGGNCLVTCDSTHPKTKEEFAVEVVNKGGTRGVILKAGHQYTITLNVFENLQNRCFAMYASSAYSGREGMCKVTTGGVTFTFSNGPGGLSRTNASQGQIPGLRFKVL